MDRYKGKRFAAFLVAAGLLAGGFFFGKVEIFAAYSTALGLIYAAYLGGQSTTDWKTIHQNGNNGHE